MLYQPSRIMVNLTHTFYLPLPNSYVDIYKVACTELKIGEEQYSFIKDVAVERYIFLLVPK